MVKGCWSWSGNNSRGEKGLSRDANKDWSLDGDIGQARVISEVVSNITSDSGKRSYVM